jgi:chromosome segregation ATPase
MTEKRLSRDEYLKRIATYTGKFGGALKGLVLADHDAAQRAEIERLEKELRALPEARKAYELCKKALKNTDEQHAKEVKRLQKRVEELERERNEAKDAYDGMISLRNIAERQLTRAERVIEAAMSKKRLSREDFKARWSDIYPLKNHEERAAKILWDHDAAQRAEIERLEKEQKRSISKIKRLMRVNEQRVEELERELRDEGYRQCDRVHLSGNALTQEQRIERAEKVIDAAQAVIDAWQVDWDSPTYGRLVTAIADYNKSKEGEHGGKA